MESKVKVIRRVPEKTFRQELMELITCHSEKNGMAFPQNMTGIMQIHFNNGSIDWTKLEMNNQF